MFWSLYFQNWRKNTSKSRCIKITYSSFSLDLDLWLRLSSDVSHFPTKFATSKNGTLSERIQMMKVRIELAFVRQYYKEPRQSNRRKVWTFTGDTRGLNLKSIKWPQLEGTSHCGPQKHLWRAARLRPLVHTVPTTYNNVRVSKQIKILTFPLTNPGHVFLWEVLGGPLLVRDVVVDVVAPGLHRRHVQLNWKKVKTHIY